jgi:hypothetical protein
MHAYKILYFKRSRRVLSLAVVLCTLFVIPDAAAQSQQPDTDRPRVKMQDATLVSGDFGTRLRGSPMILARNLDRSTELTEDLSKWNYLKEKGQNVIRICFVDPWYRQRGSSTWSIDELLPHLDIAVDNASDAGMYIIINYHDVGRYDMGYLTEFWEKIAPRYRDRTHVVYEIVNEPTFDSNLDNFMNSSLMDDFETLYNIMREGAPNTHIMLFSFNNLSYPMKTLADTADFVDWSNASIAFHFYGNNSTDRLEEVMEDYAVMCTEWDYPGRWDYVPELEGEHVNSQSLERLGISWTDWRDWNDLTFTRYENILLPDAEEKGYLWEFDIDYVPEAVWASLPSPETIATAIRGILHLYRGRDAQGRLRIPARSLITKTQRR